MREVLRVTRDRDAEAALWLEIIDLFDGASAGGTNAEELARVAARATGRPVGLQDVWNGHTLHVSGDRAEHGEAAESGVPGVAIARRLRGRNAAEVELEGSAALAASVEIGAGRVGVAWLLGAPDAEWRPLDYLVVERLAAALATHALELRGGGTTDAVAIERLLGGGLSEYELAQASRRAGLSASHRYAIVALGQTPPNAVSLEALGAVVERALAATDVAAFSTVVGRIAVVLSAADPALEPALRSLSERDHELGFAIEIGISDPAWLDTLAVAWEQAREALALREMTGPGARVGAFRDLGDLHLLAQIPRDEILASPLLQRLLETVGQHGSPSDLDVLEAYLDEGTLRRAAARVYLHHTSVEHRVKRLEEALDLDFGDAGARFEVHLTIKLYRILQSRDSARTLL